MLGGLDFQRLRGSEAPLLTTLDAWRFGGLNLEILNVEIDPKVIPNLSQIDRSGVILGACLAYFGSFFGGVSSSSP